MTTTENLPRFVLHDGEDPFTLGFIMKQWLEPGYRKPSYAMLCLLTDDVLPLLQQLFNTHCSFTASIGNLKSVFRIEKFKKQESSARWLIELSEEWGE